MKDEGLPVFITIIASTVLVIGVIIVAAILGAIFVTSMS